MLTHEERSQINDKIKSNKIFIQEQCDQLSKDIWDHKDTLDQVKKNNEYNRKKLNYYLGILIIGLILCKLK